MQHHSAAVAKPFPRRWSFVANDSGHLHSGAITALGTRWDGDLVFSHCLRRLGVDMLHADRVNSVPLSGLAVLSEEDVSQMRAAIVAQRF
mmetsp:Transcript_29005/g.67221  ORF Transcript_29005/g.67221 Transcript_29005/m.67221 type:complete len:90 (-) Transcript_29005:293-562(-)